MNTISLEDHERIVAGLKRALDKALAENAANYAAAKNIANNTRDSDCLSAPCSSSSLTPETTQYIRAVSSELKADGNYPNDTIMYLRTVKLARTLERERDCWRSKAVDLHARYKGALEDMETEIAERNEARRIAKDACELLDSEGYQVNYPPMPWEPDSPELVEPDSPENATVEQPPGQRHFDTPPSI